MNEHITQADRQWAAQQWQQGPQASMVDPETANNFINQVLAGQHDTQVRNMLRRHNQTFEQPPFAFVPTPFPFNNPAPHMPGTPVFNSGQFPFDGGAPQMPSMGFPSIPPMLAHMPVFGTAGWPQTRLPDPFAGFQAQVAPFPGGNATHQHFSSPDGNAHFSSSSVSYSTNTDMHEPGQSLAQTGTPVSHSALIDRRFEEITPSPPASETAGSGELSTSPGHEGSRLPSPHGGAFDEETCFSNPPGRFNTSVDSSENDSEGNESAHEHHAADDTDAREAILAAAHGIHHRRNLSRAQSLDMAREMLRGEQGDTVRLLLDVRKSDSLRGIDDEGFLANCHYYVQQMLAGKEVVAPVGL
ncbi:hypothetical protein MBLNU230_g7230t1 [Neophaeotheca triangularis]